MSAALAEVETPTSLVDVLERVLDRGIVVDARVSVMVLGVRLVEVDSVVVVASLPRYVSLGQPRGRDATPRPRRRRKTTRRRQAVLRRFRCEQGCGFHLAAPARPQNAVVRCPYRPSAVCPVNTL